MGIPLNPERLYDTGDSFDPALTLNEGEVAYTVGDLARILGVSRTTLLYYEEIGVVSPLRTTGGYRKYRAGDVNRVMTALMLKNLGYSLEESVALLRSDAQSLDSLATCERELERQILVKTAQLESIRATRVLKSETNILEVRVIEPYLAVVGPGERIENETFDKVGVDSFGVGQPIESFCSVYGEHLANEGLISCGHALPQRFGSLVSSMPPNVQILGGCTCLYHVDHTAGVTTSAGVDRQACNRLAAYLESHGLEQVGPAFSVRSLLTDEGLYRNLCVPIQA